ncbi:MAG: sigma-70 family RNA polymerase sigma factor [Tenericutes bacterium]|nr:sigma-70 family RNA polymerase sigma factor [Bacilli bacterium]MDD4623932.1 sigma-70 family RNA polymerase sigma factor [Bacilli bacterium]MDD4831758.1 sigma-70 family RNA polymerase sigma factor [Bacilli bacterium]NLV90341.1 sigma-70 family RNA polymerase sigma factor [Mycoplasmatota bacterium]
MYKNINDYELIYLVEEKDENALNILYDKYKPIVDLKAKKYLKYGKKIGLEYEDLYQEGMLGLSEAIVSFDQEKNAQFKTFANLCMERQIFSLLKKASRKKHTLLNDSVSLDEKINDDENTLLDVFFEKGTNPSELYEYKESKKELFEKIYSILTPLEKEVFDLKINNFDYNEISQLLNKSYKSVDSSIQRIRIKVRKIIDEIQIN